ncbi:MAG: hypothetical protein ACODTL_20450 [Brucella sp.]
MKYEETYFKYAMHNISISIAHMKDITDIDNRCYWITIHLKGLYSEDIKFISESIYKSINYAFKETKHCTIENKNSLLIDFDVAGSREWNVGNCVKLNPHMHGLIILNKNVANRYGKDDITNEIQCSIMKYNKLRKYISKTSIHLFDNNRNSIFTYVDYIRKYDKQRHDGMGKGMFLFPYSIHTCKKNIGIKKQVIDRAKDISEMLLDPTSGIFSPDHHKIVMDDYRAIDLDYASARNDEERQNCKSSFLKSVFT